jgi:hypothetical protein
LHISANKTRVDKGTKTRYLLLFCVVSLVDCPVGDVYCPRDKVGFEAIVRLFSQIDDDSDGSLDRTESDEVCIIVHSIMIYNDSMIADGSPAALFKLNRQLVLAVGGLQNSV